MQIRIIEDQNNINNFVNFIKTTNFYKEVIGELFLDEKEQEVYYIPKKKNYTKRDEVGLWTDLNKTEYPFMISDIAGYEGDISNLKKIN